MHGRAPAAARARPRLCAARDQLQQTGLDGLPVLEAGRLAGIVTRRAIAKAIRDQDAAPAAGPA